MPTELQTGFCRPTASIKSKFDQRACHCTHLAFHFIDAIKDPGSHKATDTPADLDENRADVSKGRGAISEAYEGAMTVKSPHGIPQARSPMRSTGRDSAKKGIKMAAIMPKRPARRVLR